MRLYWSLYLSARGEVCTRTVTYLPLMNDDEFAVMETWSIEEIKMLNRYRDLIVAPSVLDYQHQWWGYISGGRKLLAMFEKQIKQKVRDQW